MSQSGQPPPDCPEPARGRSVGLLTSAQPVDYSRFLDRIGMSLARAGYRVTLVGLDRTTTDPLPSELDCVRVRPARGIHKPRVLRDMFRAARKLRADVLQCFDPWALALGLLVKRRRPDTCLVYEATESYPQIQLQRRDIPFPLRWLNYVCVRLLENEAVRHADRLVDTTRTRARRFARLGRRVTVVQNLPPLNLVPGTGPEHRPWIVYTGLICRHRGVDVLLKAFATIAPRIPDARLRILGRFAPGEGLEDWTHDFLKRTGLESRVDFLGWIPTYQGMFQELASCSVGVVLFQPNWWNDYTNLPDKLFDFMATGLAVVASRFPEMSRVVNETGCGWLVDPTSPEAVAAALERALTSPDECRARGEAGKRAVLARYHWGVAEKALLDLYAGLAR